jgi:hypothetical protein
MAIGNLKTDERRDILNIEMVVILMLLSFIIGLVVGVNLGRPTIMR